MKIPPDETAILTREEVAAWLQLRPRQVDRLGVPVLNLGPRTKRYLAGDVLAWMARMREDRPRRGARRAA